MLETFRGSSLRTLSPLEDQAHKVLTPYAFKIFQKEVERATQYSVYQENRIEFVVTFLVYSFTKIVTIFHHCIYHLVGVAKSH